MDIHLIAAKTAYKDALAGYFQVSAPAGEGRLLIAAGRVAGAAEPWQRRQRALEAERALYELAPKTEAADDLLARLGRQIPEAARGPVAVGLLAADGALSLRAAGLGAYLLWPRAQAAALKDGALRLEAAETRDATALILVEGDPARAEEIARALAEAERVFGAGAAARLMLAASTSPVEAALVEMRADLWRALSSSRATKTQDKLATLPPALAAPASQPLLPWAVAGGAGLIALLALLVALFRGPEEPKAAPPQPKPVPVEEPVEEEEAPAPKPPAPESGARDPGGAPKTAPKPAADAEVEPDPKPEPSTPKTPAPEPKYPEKKKKP